MSLEKEREDKALSPTGIMDALENFKEPFPYGILRRSPRNSADRSVTVEVAGVSQYTPKVATDEDEVDPVIAEGLDKILNTLGKK